MNAWDVIVIGAGPAGIAAAIAAARGGAHTLLIEKNPCLGGTWTAGAMNLVLDADNKGGIMAEIAQRLAADGAWERWCGYGWAFAIEPMKLLLDGMAEAAGVEVRLQTLLVDVRVRQRRITSLVLASKSGWEEVGAPVVIDASGDGDVGARAGCRFAMGRPQDGKMQPATMFGTVVGWPTTVKEGRVAKDLLLQAGFDLTYHHVTIFPQPGLPEVQMLMLSHVYAVDGTSAGSASDGERRGRRDVAAAVAALRAADARFAGLRLLSTGPFLALREGRRIQGLYELTDADCEAGRRFADAVTEVTFNFDVHHIDPGEGRFLWHQEVPPYQIPYRSLIAADVDNLLLAGRCISGQFKAHSSYRVTGDAVALGQAAGAAAAIAVREHLPLAEVPASRIAVPARA
jgi:hypothetical protein